MFVATEGPEALGVAVFLRLHAFLSQGAPIVLASTGVLKIQKKGSLLFLRESPPLSGSARLGRGCHLYVPAFFIYLFIYLFMTVLGLRFCARALSSCGKWGPLFIAVRGPLIIAASLVAEHRLRTRRLSNCGSRAQLLRGMWDLPRPGLKPVSPALAGRLSTTAPPGKPSFFHFEFS